MKKLLGIIFLAVLISGCSKAPSDKEVQSIITQSILSDGFGDLFKIEGFKKTNGFQQSDNIYLVDVEYDLVFQKSFVQVVREVSDNPTGPQYGLFGSKVLLITLQSSLGEFEVGDKIHKKVKITLINTEQGWQISE